MELSSIQRPAAATDVDPEQLAGNSRLTTQQKIAEASRQFEAVLLRQILSDAQKTVIKSEYSDGNSTSSGIYHDMITTSLADNISKSGGFGLAKVFEHQLTTKGSAADSATTAVTDATAKTTAPAVPAAKTATTHTATKSAAPNPFSAIHRHGFFPSLTPDS